jgi:hypothetical protein
MSTTRTSSRPPYLRRLIESRPPCLTWSRSLPPQTNQPPLTPALVKAWTAVT